MVVPGDDVALPGKAYFPHGVPPRRKAQSQTPPRQSLRSAPTEPPLALLVTDRHFLPIALRCLCPAASITVVACHRDVLADRRHEH
jgi:hypothetical protein